MGLSMNQEVINWLLEGDPSIRWQTLRNLCSASESEIEKERSKIESEGWGKRLLSFQDPSGTWDNGLYTPKWTSTTYTLLLRRLGLKPDEKCRKGCQFLLDNGLYKDGGSELPPAIARSFLVQRLNLPRFL
ncbi:MAG: hypothetical protein Q6362_010830, partial [Candidatus Wukongarchaeota archaeon]|nr:hypothetical protein [Candidatus Wukongarchaeota archaeon]